MTEILFKERGRFGVAHTQGVVIVPCNYRHLSRHWAANSKQPRETGNGDQYRVTIFLHSERLPSNDGCHYALNALGDCRGNGWLTYIFKYLPHRRRLCDEPNQAHPPAAPAAVERKHAVNARQQLCPQISRRVSCPRHAKICAHCLCPGCLTPRPRLPANICRHQRPPRRVRRQHPEDAVPMLARRWYQYPNPIQKLTCAQPRFNRSLLLLLRYVPLQRRPLQPVAHLRPASRPYQPLTGKHRARTISQQPLTPSTILRYDPHARMHRKTATVPPPLH